MRELLRTSDRIRLGYLVVLLRAEGIEAIVFDAETSQAFAGGPLVPMRLAVATDDYARARRLLADAGELPAPPPA